MIVIRKAAAGDALAMGALYVRVWQDTYPSILPNDVLLSMCPEKAAARWSDVIAVAGGRRGAVVAEDEATGELVGLASFGPNREAGLAFAGEIYTLYVDIDAQDLGVGRALLRSAFTGIVAAGSRTAVAWTLSHNQHRFFYPAVGAREAARKTGQIGGMPVALSAYGWDDLPAWLVALARDGRHAKRPESGPGGAGRPGGVGDVPDTAHRS